MVLGIVFGRALRNSHGQSKAWVLALSSALFVASLAASVSSFAVLDTIVGVMTDAAIAFLLGSQGSEDCAERMASSVYAGSTTVAEIAADTGLSTPEITETSAAMRPRASVLTGVVALLLRLLLCARVV